MTPLFTEAEFQAAKGKDPLPLQCIQCKRTFHLTRTRVKQAMNPNRIKRNEKGDFCGLSCKATHTGPPVIVQCLQCHTMFEKHLSEIKKSPNHFCGHPCAATYMNSHKTTGTRVSKLEVWLQAQLPSLYPELKFHFNRRDTVMSELDIYIPTLRLAFELNGIFHYKPIYGVKPFSWTQSNDKKKSQACLELGIELVVVDVSKMKNFKEALAPAFLDLIREAIDRY